MNPAFRTPYPPASNQSRIRFATPRKSVFRVLSCAVLAAGLLPLTATASISGGGWYLGPSTSPPVDCNEGETGNYYIGACNTSGDAQNQDVEFHDGSIGAPSGGGLIGGLSRDGGATGNTVTMSETTGSSTVTGDVYGGYSINGDATGNTVKITGGHVYSEGSPPTIAGGYSESGAARNNHVQISGSGSKPQINGFVYGGHSKENANDNTVTISGGLINDYVDGGYSSQGNANGNTVTMSGGTVADSVTGGYADGDTGGSGDANGNNVTISGNARITGATYGGYSQKGSASANNVTIKGGAIGSENTDHVFEGAPVSGGYAAGTGARQNTVTISGGRMGRVAGGTSFSDQAAADNTVTISGGVITPTTLVPTPAAVMGGLSFSGDAIGNEVLISGGTINGNVVGGLSFFGGTHGNTVKITGGTVNGDVLGGWTLGGGITPNDTVIIGGDAVIHGDVYGAKSRSGDVTENRVILKGNPSFDAETVIWGGMTGSEGGIVSGNVLEVRTKGLTAKNVRNFAEYHFLLPADTKNNDVVLKLTAAGGTDLGQAGVGVAMQSGGSLLQMGDKIALIHNANGVDATQVSQIASGGMKNADGTLYQGVSLGYKFKLKTDKDLNQSDGKNQNLYAVILKAPQKDHNENDSAAFLLDQTKAPLEGRASGLAFVNQGANLAAGSGMNSAIRHDGIPLFFALSGGSSRYDTGSHVDVDGVNMMLGAAMHFGSFTVAPFVEGGTGSYDTYNDFSGHDVHGSGETSYVGAGVMLHQQWQSGLYVEGAIRGGSLDYDWHSYDMKGAGEASYDSSSTYFGANAGLGYKLLISDSTHIDLSAQYFWTHLDDDSATIAGDRYDFDSVDSQRTRLGVRVTQAFNDHFSAYADVAWLHEFDGDAVATVYGMHTPAPSLEGDTGEFGAGVNFSPSADNPLTIGLGVNGYVGTREGVTGRLNIGWAF